MKKTILILAMAAVAFGQCGTLVVNPTTGRLDCIGVPGGGGNTFTNTEHSLAGWQFYPDSSYSNVDVSAFPVDYTSGTFLAPLLTGWPTISNAVWSAGTVTLTVSSTTLISSASRVQVEGVTPSFYNSTPAIVFPVMTVVDATHATYAVATNPGAYVSGGVVSTSNGNRLGLDNGMAINVATSSTPTPATAVLGGSGQSDVGAFPITGSMIVEGGGTVASPGSCGDCHLLVLNSTTGFLYEGYAISTTAPPYTFGSVAIFNLQSNNLRTNYTNWVFTGGNNDVTGMTSADVSGLSITDKVLTHAELFAGCPGGVGVCTPVKHVLRITFEQATGSGSGGYTWPASHGGIEGVIPIGIRMTLPLSYPTSCQAFDRIGEPFTTYPPMVSIVWTLQHYGAVFTDFGFPGQMALDADTAWGNGSTGTDLSNVNFWIHCVLSQDLEVIKEEATQGINLGAIK
jgi:hypothetical protein